MTFMEIEEKVTALLDEERNMSSEDRLVGLDGLFSDSDSTVKKNALEQKIDAMPPDELHAISEEVCRRIRHLLRFFEGLKSAKQIGFRQDQHYLKMRIEVGRLMWLYLQTAGENFDFSKVSGINEIMFPNQQ